MQLSNHIPARLARAGLIALALAWPGSGTARAQGQDMAADEPWTRGVPAATQQAAREIFLAGNKLFNEALFGKAAEKYQQALERMPHPFIYYNLAVAQINLGQHLEAYHSLRGALQYGAEHLGEAKHRQAQSYLAMLEGQLARIAVACAQPGARVTLDGRILFDGPGEREEIVYAGEHQLVATRPGHMPDTERVVLAPGARERVELEPLVPGGVTSQRRWAAWKPWAVVGAGVVVGLAGGAVHWRSAHNFDRFDDEYHARECAAQTGDAGVLMGCSTATVAGEFGEVLDSARWQRRVATASYVAAGAAVATGLVLVYLNRTRLVSAQARSGDAVVGVTPDVSHDYIGLSAGVRF